MRLDIRYKVRFRYAHAVRHSHNEVRMKPREDRYQRVVYYQLRSNPPVRLLQASDYWGTAVDHLGVRSSHTQLKLTAESTVETAPRPIPTEKIAVATLQDENFRSEYNEFLVPSQHVQWQPSDAFIRQAAKAAEKAESLSEMIVSVIQEARNALAYIPGSTEIGVSLAELWEGKAGVCQDFAHLAIGMLRSVGVPACYVSGYLFAADETSLIGERTMDSITAATIADTAARPIFEPNEVRVQTHAWIMAALPGHGWWALDPTNNSLAGERHVVVGYGRDYTDVPPVRGVFMGGSAWSDVDSVVVIGKQDTDSNNKGDTVQHGPSHIIVQSRSAMSRNSNRRN